DREHDDENRHDERHAASPVAERCPSRFIEIVASVCGLANYSALSEAPPCELLLHAKIARRPGTRWRHRAGSPEMLDELLFLANENGDSGGRTHGNRSRTK